MDKINSLTGMMDLLAGKTNKEELANKIFYTEKVLQEIFDNFKISQIRTWTYISNQSSWIENNNFWQEKTRNIENVNGELQKLHEASKQNTNLMPYIIKAVKSSATLGEISDILRKSFGIHS